MLALMVTAPMTGDDVVTLQERLSELGYDPGRPGGVFDEQTEHALRRFQREYGLVPDGLCGPATLRSLRQLGRKVTGGRPHLHARAGAAAPGRARGCAASGSSSTRATAGPTAASCRRASPRPT